jgi:predicted nucleic acid-binding Zn ribbon protein
VESKMKDIRLAFTHDFVHPRPFSTYRPRLVASCPDLYSALYYQLACLIEDKRPWMNCVICGLPVPRTRSNRETCSAACRKAKSRRSKATRELRGPSCTSLSYTLVNSNRSVPPSAPKIIRKRRAGRSDSIRPMGGDEFCRANGRF